jgi:hypothetical protein
MRSEGIESYVETVLLPVLRTRRVWRVQDLVKLLDSLKLPPKEIMEYLVESNYIRVVGLLVYVEGED